LPPRAVGPAPAPCRPLGRIHPVFFVGKSLRCFPRMQLKKAFSHFPALANQAANRGLSPVQKLGESPSVRCPSLGEPPFTQTGFFFSRPVSAFFLSGPASLAAELFLVEGRPRVPVLPAGRRRLRCVAALGPVFHCKLHRCSSSSLERPGEGIRSAPFLLSAHWGIGGPRFCCCAAASAPVPASNPPASSAPCCPRVDSAGPKGGGSPFSSCRILAIRSHRSPLGLEVISIFNRARLIHHAGSNRLIRPRKAIGDVSG